MSSSASSNRKQPSSGGTADKRMKKSSEIYENLPCDQQQQRRGEAEEKKNCPNGAANQAALNSKEMLYATPLRKSDRFKQRDKSVEKDGENGEKILNTAASTKSKSSNKSTASIIPNQDPILEQRRMRNFLKDQVTTSNSHLNKKMDPAVQMNSNFSALAHEEHFANLVQQNVLNSSNENEEESIPILATGAEQEVEEPADETMTLEELEEKCLKNLDYLTRNMNNKESPDKEQVKELCEENELKMPVKRDVPLEKMLINREWVLKKIVLCLEQRNFKKPIPTPGNAIPEAVANEDTKVYNPHNHNNLPQLGCLVLGSNGSGKTTICQSILEGGNGTKGILNRRLLCCYFINSQSPECHSISVFIRSLVLQILSHSSYLFRDENEDHQVEQEVKEEVPVKSDSPPKESKLNKLTTEKIKELEEMLISELQLSGSLGDSPMTTGIKKNVIRQQSDPVTKSELSGEKKSFGTHPQLNGKLEKDVDNSNAKKLSSPMKKISKIPVKIGTPRGSPKVSISQEEGENNSDDKSGQINSNSNQKEDDNDMTNSEADSCSAPEADRKLPEEEEKPKESEVEVTKEKESEEKSVEEKSNQVEEEPKSEHIPPPLPKSIDCRTVIADNYYEMLVSNPEIFESLSQIEKNPDECFKKVILFPLLELTPPKTSLLFLIDSIDENYITESNLISTLKKNSRNSGPSSNKSQNIAELLAQHVHLLPKWLFLVSTGKKQNKHITKMFSGFKKITIDDLRKSHVVKDVQEYIILRLNTDFKNAVNLTKDVIDSLNQLYLKSNGCILYLQKVLDGIKENFFTFREIKMLPCSLNGLYLYICQKSFNKKQYHKIRPILNILLAADSHLVEKSFVFNCLRTQNYSIDMDEFQKRLSLMHNILVFDKDETKLKIFHNSFCDWLIDVKFSTKKFLCDVNEGHIMISMYYTLISDQLCPNNVRKFIYHLIKSGEFLQGKNVNLDLILLLLESKANLSDCFYTNSLNCCKSCELDARQELNLNLPKTKQMLTNFIDKAIRNEKFQEFLIDFFKPNLPTDAKTLKLLIETGINNADPQLSYDSSIINSPALSDKSQNIDSELAELLISSERSCNITNNIAASEEASTATVPPVHPMPPAQERERNQTEPPLEATELVDSNFMEIHKGKALIHILANEGNHILLERALNACKDPIDLEIEDVNGQTALNIACRTGHVDVVKLLLGFRQADVVGRIRSVDVNHADRDGWTPLRSASWGGHTEVVKLLIAQPGCAIDLADKEGRTALRAAAWSGHEDILKILIEAGANVNSVDKQGRTSLIAASYMGQYDIVEILLENGADVNHLDLDGRSALCVAALCGSSGYSRVISTLLEHGANTDQLDNDGMSPLLVSAFEGNSEICELLLENGADPDLADFMGRTPLWAACTAGYAKVVKLLLFWGCSIDCMDSEGRTVLSIAAAQGNLETVRQLLDRGLDETHRDNAGWTPLHYAAFEGYPEVCEQLLESGAKIDECDNEGKTALHLAAQEGHNAVIEALLDIHSACVDQKAHDGKTAFRLACLESHFSCVETLLKYTCDPNIKDADSRTTLYILALENKLKIVKFLLEYANGLDVNIPDNEGRTALHVAAWQGHAEMVKLLIQVGQADVNAMDLEARTPLHSCAWQGNHEVMEILLIYGAIPDHSCKQGASALGISAQEGHEQCVSILLQYGANPFKSDHCGRTPIKLAAKSNRNNVLRILESYTKLEHNVHHPGGNQLMAIKSPDRPEKPIQMPLHLTTTTPVTPNGNFLVPNNIGSNATNSTQSSNFYENTMHSDHSSVNKRKSVISSHSTGSSNEQVPISFTQQLQKQSRQHGPRSAILTNNQPVVNGKFSSKKHSNVLPNVQEHQTNIVNEADLFDLGCMSPLYATPPHSPSSEISSPGQHLPGHHHFEEIGEHGTKHNSITDHHFTRDTHMRIILGNASNNLGGKDGSSSGQNASKSKRTGIATNPAMRIIRDSAANFIRRTNNILTSSSSNQGSSSVKSGTFQWRKESQM